MTKIKEVRMAL